MRSTATGIFTVSINLIRAADEAIENPVDGVESALYKRALAREVIPAIFYLKAHRPIYRDRLNIDDQTGAERDPRATRATYSER